ncbi:MAG: 4Fe-4S dicluster domain-containing protein [Dehalococcoidales bacterium]
MPEKILVSDQFKCTGCRSCEVWCSFYHLREINPSRARLSIVAYEDKGVFVPMICHQCRDAWCLSECPVNAITRDPETDAVVINDSLCNGCLACADACLFGAIKITEAGDVYKCDLCQGDPVCVQSCTRGALTYTEATRAYLDKLTALADRMEGTV